MLESFGCRFFGPVASCAVAVVDYGGQSNVRHVHIGGAEAEVNGFFDTLVFCHGF